MDLNLSLILVLLTLNVFQLVWWSWQTHKLIDKLMSRSYFEYKEAKKPVIPSVKLAEEPVEAEDLRVMDDYLNQMM